MSTSHPSGPLATQLADAANEYGQAFAAHQPIDGEAVAALTDALWRAHPVEGVPHPEPLPVGLTASETPERAGQ